MLPRPAFCFAHRSLVTRKLLRRAFEKANCVVDVAENGDVAYEKMKMSLYDTVFMDLDMPVLDGIEATRQLRKWEDVHRKGARQPICALTSAVLDDAERRRLIELKGGGRGGGDGARSEGRSKAKALSSRPQITNDLLRVASLLASLIVGWLGCF